MYEPEPEPSIGSRLLYPVIGIVAAIVVVLVAVFALGIVGDDDDGGGGASAGSPTPEGSAGQGGDPMQQALGTYVQSTLNQNYAGDCAAPAPPPNQTPAPGQTPAAGGGGLCSSKRGERENVHAYVLGQPLQEPTQWAFLEQRSGNWQVTFAPRITGDNRAVPGIPWPLKTGVEVVVIGADPCVNVREGPSLGQAAVDSICDGTKLRIGAGPAEADGFVWWQIEGRSGWIVSDFLRYEDATQ
jgi:hypothetical protein